MHELRLSLPTTHQSWSTEVQRIADYNIAGSSTNNKHVHNYQTVSHLGLLLQSIVKISTSFLGVHSQLLLITFKVLCHPRPYLQKRRHCGNQPRITQQRAVMPSGPSVPDSSNIHTPCVRTAILRKDCWRLSASIHPGLGNANNTNIRWRRRFGLHNRAQSSE